MGLFGCCRSKEMLNLTVSQVRDLGESWYIDVTNTKTYLNRTFKIDESFYGIVKKYVDMRPKNATTDRFFIGVRSGKCINQPVGIHTIYGQSQEVAEYLGLPNPKTYTGHSLRRTAAKFLADEGAGLLDMKRAGGWRGDSSVQGYIAGSASNKNKIGSFMANAMQKGLPDKNVQTASTSTTTTATQVASRQPVAHLLINHLAAPTTITSTTRVAPSAGPSGLGGPPVRLFLHPSAVKSTMKMTSNVENKGKTNK